MNNGTKVWLIREGRGINRLVPVSGKLLTLVATLSVAATSPAWAAVEPMLLLGVLVWIGGVAVFIWVMREVLGHHEELAPPEPAGKVVVEPAKTPEEIDKKASLIRAEKRKVDAETDLKLSLTDKARADAEFERLLEFVQDRRWEVSKRQNGAHRMEERHE